MEPATILDPGYSTVNKMDNASALMVVVLAAKRMLFLDELGWLFIYLVMLGIEARALHMLGMCFTTN